MSGRPPAVQEFVDALGAALRLRVGPTDPPAPVVDRMLAALAQSGVYEGAVEPDDLPVLDHLPAALDTAADPLGSVAAVAGPLRALVGGLDWAPRAGAATVGEVFLHGHANAQIIGPAGQEQRRDVTVGLSLMAPGVRYPDHCHPPEEVYLVLSPGEWWQAGGAWYAPGIGGIVHNPPGIMHAMRSGEAPLLAIWLLWMEG